MTTSTPRQPKSTLNADSIPTGTLCIIAGSRSATDLLSDRGLQTLLSSAIDTADFTPDAVISGTARGVDQAGEDWARKNGRLPVAQFPAPWDQHGRAAGPIRNEWMAEYATHHGDRGVLLAILVYDEDGQPSNGTSDMIDTGRDHLGDDNVFVVPLGNVDETHVNRELAPVVHRL